MRSFLFRLSRLITFISIGLICFLYYYIIEDTLTPLSDFFKKNPNGTMMDVFEIFFGGVYALMLIPFVFVLIVALFNWMIFGKRTLWIKKEFTDSKINKNIILFRLSRAIAAITTFFVFIFLLDLILFILAYLINLILLFFDIPPLPINDRFNFYNHLGLLSIFICIIYNWLCFEKISIWIKNQNKENIE